MKIFSLLSISMVAAALAITVGNAAESAATPVIKTNIENASSSFVVRAAQGGILEVEAGKLAVSKSSNADIKAFAQQMINDHGKANIELEQLAGTRYPVPKKLDADHQAKLELLMTKSGSEFDQAYSKEMVRDHVTVIKLFTEAANDNSVNSDLRQFASRTLPTLQQHHVLSTKLPGDAAK